MKNVFIILCMLALACGLMFIPAQAATITAMQASVTKTAAYDQTPTTAVAALSGDFTFKLQISALSVTSGNPATVRFCLEDVATADYTTPNYAWCVQKTGSIAAGADAVYSIRAYEIPDTVALAWGQTNGKFRISLVRIAGTGASVTYSAWLEQ